MVYLFLTDGFEMIEALTPVDVLRRAGVATTTVSITGREEVKSSSEVYIKADSLYEECDFGNLSTLILPGGPGTSSLIAHEGLCRLVMHSYEQQKLICAICAAPKLLTHVGIKARTSVYPTLSGEVHNYCPDPICIDDNIITADAMASSLDFALNIVRLIKGDAAADEVATKIVKQHKTDCL